jgi:diadenosine tetraphosphate (Ap4A) HIT family hydrolase
VPEDAPCPFCGIARGQAEASLVYEDETVIAFMDMEPATTGHLLLTPRTHIPSLADLPGEIGVRLFAIASQLARALRQSDLPCDGVNLLLADGEAAGQEVPHLHLHLVPRTWGDGFQIHGQWRVRSRSELDETAERIRRGLAGLYQDASPKPAQPGEDDV